MSKCFRKPSVATFQGLHHSSLLDRRVEIPYCIISFHLPFSLDTYNTLTNDHCTQVATLISPTSDPIISNIYSSEFQ